MWRNLKFKEILNQNVKESEICQEWSEFMVNLFSKGYALKLTKVPKDGNLWYILLHCVCNENKPVKIKYMFDCGSEYQGKSLNKKVIWTPGSKKQIFSVLIRHRQKLVAILADIESMFYQVSVVEEHQDFLKFFFSELNDVIKEC